MASIGEKERIQHISEQLGIVVEDFQGTVSKSGELSILEDRKGYILRDRDSGKTVAFLEEVEEIEEWLEEYAQEMKQSFFFIHDMETNPAFDDSDLEFLMEVRGNIQDMIDCYARKTIPTGEPEAFNDKEFIAILARDLILHIGGYSAYLKILHFHDATIEKRI